MSVDRSAPFRRRGVKRRSLAQRLMLLLIDGPGPWWVPPLLFFGAMGVMGWSIEERLLSAWWRMGPLAVMAVAAWWMRSRYSQHQYYKGLARYSDWSRCPRCGYDVGDLPEGRCPECGVTASEEVERARRITRE